VASRPASRGPTSGPRINSFEENTQVPQTISSNRLRSSAFILILPSMALAIACGGGGPIVLTSTPSHVAVEFAIEGSLAEATQLAQAECAKSGLVADFSNVQKEATPTTRVAKFTCVPGDAAAEPAPAAAEPEVAPSAAAPDADAAPTAEPEAGTP
jgi:hypothetical protein